MYMLFGLVMLIHQKQISQLNMTVLLLLII